MTEQRILDAAIDQFGACGFDGASTRAISSASGAAMSSITYHFGGKEGLYLAVADHIASNIAAFLGPYLATVRAEAGAGRDTAIEGALTLLGGFAAMMLDPQSERWSRFIIREQQNPSEAFDRLFEGAMEPIAHTMIDLVARARPDLGDRQARATAMLLIGQALVLRAARASVCRIMQCDELDEPARALLRERLLASARCILEQDGD